MDLLAELEHRAGPQLTAARHIAETLGGAGHRTWLVGGCVRDLLLGRDLHDLDLAGPAPPGVVEALFPRTVAVGRAFGVVRVLSHGQDLEVATFRVESGTRDGRRPAALSLVATPEEDASRRDFTLNALYLDPLTGELVDPVGGRADLEQRVLRAVGDAEDRFREDGLRLLRMARFLACLDLRPADGLLEAARSCRDTLARISSERVLDELGKIARGEQRESAVELLARAGLLTEAFPHLRHSGLGPAERAALVRGVRPDDLLLALLDLEPDVEGRMDLLARTLDDLPLARSEAAHLSSSWSRLEEIRSLPPGAPADLDAAQLARLLRGREGGSALRLARAWAKGLGGDGGRLEELEKWASGRDLEPAPLLAARDLLALGCSPGPGLGALLRALEDEQLRGTLTDQVGALAWARQQLELDPT